MKDRTARTDAVNEIMGIVETKYYQVACQKYFTYLHNNTPPKKNIHHPNQYFSDSVEIRDAQSSAASGASRQT